jgi:hypothetical protein
MYYGDHPPPHFHALEDNDNCLISIDALELLAGNISRRSLNKALMWAKSNQLFLQQCWDNFNEEE